MREKVGMLEAEKRKKIGATKMIYKSRAINRQQSLKFMLVYSDIARIKPFASSRNNQH